MSIPFIDLKRIELGFREKYIEIVRTLTETTSFIGGEIVEEFEEKLKTKTSTNFAISCANGTDALQIALRALRIGPGDKVLIPDLTFWATFEAVINVGASPVTVEINPDDGQLCFESIKTVVVEEKPKAIIVVHLYGWGMTHLQRLREFCVINEIFLIEDGAQSFGTIYNNESIYKNALIATTSFYPAKVLGAAGDAGAIFTNDEILASTIRKLSNHGRDSHYGYGLVGWNSRLDTLQAAYLNLAIDHIDDRIKSRINSANMYRRLLVNESMVILNAPTDYLENGYCNVCIIEDVKLKNKIELGLKKNKIGFGNIYPGTITEQIGAKSFFTNHQPLPISKKFTRSVLNLPLFAYMFESEVIEVCSTINTIINEA